MVEPGERRKFPRLAASVDVEYNILKKKASLKQKTLSKNISAGGICLIVYEKIEPGTELALRFHLSDSDYNIKAKGRVVWMSPFSVGSEQQERYDLGIEFTQIDKQAQEKIAQYIFSLK